MNATRYCSTACQAEGKRTAVCSCAWWNQTLTGDLRCGVTNRAGRSKLHARDLLKYDLIRALALQSDAQGQPCTCRRSRPSEMIPSTSSGLRLSPFGFDDKLP